MSSDDEVGKELYRQRVSSDAVKMVFRARWRKRGEHYWVTIFSGEEGFTFYNIGTLCMRDVEVVALKSKTDFIWIEDDDSIGAGG